MKQRKFIKKSLITLISWTLCYMPIAVSAQDVDIVDLPEANISTPSNNVAPNFCIDDQTFASKIRECTNQGLVINCHLNVCTTSANNADYDKEYQKCESYPTTERQKCRDNLINFGNDLADHNRDMEGGVSAGGDTSALSTVAGAAGAVVAIGCAYFGWTCVSDGFGQALLGAIGLAVMFMSMQGKQYKKQFKQAAEMLKNEDQRDIKGWSAETQSAALQKQIMAIDMIIKAAKDKSKNHKMVAALTGVIGVIAAVCVAAVITGCPVTNSCAISTAIAAFVVMALELKAASESDDIASKWKKNKEIAVELKRKLDLLYKKGNEHIANMNGVNPGANVGGSLAQTQLQSGLASSSLESIASEAAPRSCVSSNGSVSDCPCIGNKCQKIKFNLPKSAIANQISNRLNTSAWETAANEAFAGNSAKLDAMTTDGNLALISGVKNKLLKHILNKKIAKGNDKDMLNAILNPSKNQGLLNSYLAKNLDPVLGATLASKYGAENLKGLDTDGMEKSLIASNKEFKIPKYNEGPKGSDLLKKLEDQLNFDDLDGALEDNSLKANLIDESLNAKASEGEVEFDDINPETKLSIFKIISNRYNIIKSKKKIGN